MSANRAKGARAHTHTNTQSAAAAATHAVSDDVSVMAGSGPEGSRNVIATADAPADWQTRPVPSIVMDTSVIVRMAWSFDCSDSPRPMPGVMDVRSSSLIIATALYEIGVVVTPRNDRTKLPAHPAPHWQETTCTSRLWPVVTGSSPTGHSRKPQSSPV